MSTIETMNSENEGAGLRVRANRFFQTLLCGYRLGGGATGDVIGVVSLLDKPPDHVLKRS